MEGLTRKEFEPYLKRFVTEHIRPLGFTGAYPHVRRIRDDQIDLVSISFDRVGRAFAVEIAAGHPGGFWSNGRLERPPEKMQTMYACGGYNRASLGPTFPEAGSRFVIARAEWEDPDRHPIVEPDELIATLRRYFDEQAQPFWDTSFIWPDHPGLFVVSDGNYGVERPRWRSWEDVFPDRPRPPQLGRRRSRPLRVGRKGERYPPELEEHLRSMGAQPPT